MKPGGTPTLIFFLQKKKFLIITPFKKQFFQPKKFLRPFERTDFLPKEKISDAYPK